MNSQTRRNRFYAALSKKTGQELPELSLHADFSEVIPAVRLSALDGQLDAGLVCYFVKDGQLEVIRSLDCVRGDKGGAITQVVAR